MVCGLGRTACSPHPILERTGSGPAHVAWRQIRQYISETSGLHEREANNHATRNLQRTALKNGTAPRLTLHDLSLVNLLFVKEHA